MRRKRLTVAVFVIAGTLPTLPYRAVHQQQPNVMGVEPNEPPVANGDQRRDQWLAPTLESRGGAIFPSLED